MTISVSQLKARVETDLDDRTLGLIIVAEEEAIVRQNGDASEVETHLASGISKLILKRRPASVVSVTERPNLVDDAVTLDATDYRMIGNRILYRLGDGVNPSNNWGAEVVVTYTVDIDANLRDRVLLDLSQLSIEFNAYSAEKDGDWSGEQKDYSERREQLLGQIREPRLGLV